MIFPHIIEPTITPEPVDDLFNFTFDEDGADFETVVPGLGAKIPLSVATVEGEGTYKHHAWYEQHPAGFGMVMHCVHDYDEGGIGQWAAYEFTDNHINWTAEAELFPPQDNNERREDNTGRILDPMGFVRVGGRVWAVMDANYRDYTSAAIPIYGTRIGIGFLIREIYANKTLGPIEWIHNGDRTFTAPAAISGFDAYSFNLQLRHLIYTMFARTDNSIKVSSSDQFYYNNEIREAPVYGFLSEPEMVRAYGYKNKLKYWKNNAEATTEFPLSGNKRKTGSYGEDESYFFTGSVPDCPNNGAIITRYLLYRGRIIILGNVDGNRKKLFGAIMIRNATTGKYDSSNVYLLDSVATGAETLQDFEGHGKGGGPQSIHGQIYGDTLHMTFSQKKEQVHYMQWDLSQVPELS